MGVCKIKSLFLLSLCFLILTVSIGVSSPEKGDAICARVKILDRSGNLYIVYNSYDNISLPYIEIASKSKGETSVLRFKREDVKKIELYEFHENKWGWEFARCLVTLNNGRIYSGYLEIYFLGMHGFRTVEGETEDGKFFISWKRIKTIEYIGPWKKYGDFYM